MSADAAPAGARVRHAGSPWGERSVAVVAALFGLFLGLPVLALVARAVLDGSLAASITSRVVVDALLLSLVTTAASLTLTVAFGLPLAWILARRSFPGKGWLEAIIDLPIVLPPSVAGLALLIVLGRRGVLGGPLAHLAVAHARPPSGPASHCHDRKHRLLHTH